MLRIDRAKSRHDKTSAALRSSSQGRSGFAIRSVEESLGDTLHREESSSSSSAFLVSDEILVTMRVKFQVHDASD